MPKSKLESVKVHADAKTGVIELLVWFVKITRDDGSEVVLQVVALTRVAAIERAIEISEGQSGLGVTDSNIVEVWATADPVYI